MIGSRPSGGEARARASAAPPRPSRRSAERPPAAEAPRPGLPRGDAAMRRGLKLIAVVAALGCLQLLFMIGVEADRMVRHRAAIAALEAELADLADEASGLRDVEAHADDDVYREQLARSLGFMRPEETRLVVVPTPTQDAR